jgi:hypothetical protein
VFETSLLILLNRINQTLLGAQLTLWYALFRFYVFFFHFEGNANATRINLFRNFDMMNFWSRSIIERWYLSINVFDGPTNYISAETCCGSLSMLVGYWELGRGYLTDETFPFLG